MDEKLRARLKKIEDQISVVYRAEERYLTLESAKDHQLAVLMIATEGSSQSQREMLAKASPVWAGFRVALAIAEAEFHREKHTLELKNNAYLAEYASFKIDNQAIAKQV